MVCPCSLQRRPLRSCFCWKDGNDALSRNWRLRDRVMPLMIHITRDLRTTRDTKASTRVRRSRASWVCMSILFKSWTVTGGWASCKAPSRQSSDGFDEFHDEDTFCLHLKPVFIRRQGNDPRLPCTLSCDVDEGYHALAVRPSARKTLTLVGDGTCHIDFLLPQAIFSPSFFQPLHLLHDHTNIVSRTETSAPSSSADPSHVRTTLVE